MQIRASELFEGEYPDQLYAMRSEDRLDVFANRIAEVLGSKNHDSYIAQSKGDRKDSLWQVLAGEAKTVVLEVGFEYIQRGGGKIPGMSPELMEHSALNQAFKARHGVNYYPDRIFKINNNGDINNLKDVTWQAYLSLSNADRKEQKSFQ